MKMPFPGMDPYLEHPALWPSVHTQLIVMLANQLSRQLRPHYVASIENRVFIEEQDRIPDILLQRLAANGSPKPARTTTTAPVIVEVEETEEEPIPLEVRQHYIEILDMYRSRK